MWLDFLHKWISWIRWKIEFLNIYSFTIPNTSQTANWVWLVTGKKIIMIKNYFKIAWRNLVKYKFISFINLFGLTVGLTCCLLITTYVLNELSYDRYNKNAENIYRVTRSFNNAAGVVSLKFGTISPPFGYYFPTDFPEIKKMTRLLGAGTLPFKYKDKIIAENNVYFADENLFNVFNSQTDINTTPSYVHI